jgi:hypothetical protein
MFRGSKSGDRRGRDMEKGRYSPLNSLGVLAVPGRTHLCQGAFLLTFWFNGSCREGRQMWGSKSDTMRGKNG